MAGSLMGHFLPGLGFFLVGLWHLFNHVQLHAGSPKSFTLLPWFPTQKIRYLELFLIMIGSACHMSAELFKHHRFDPDGTIPSPHLRNFEHASITMTFILYSSFAIILDFVVAKAIYGLTHLLAALALAQQFLMFRFHSTHHAGLEGQYHLFVQILTLLSITTTLMGIGFPRSFVLAFSRSLCLTFLGVWLMATGVMLWTPSFIPKGCFHVWEEGHQEVRCHDDESLHRAKALINIEFSWFLIAITIFSVSYVYLVEGYGEKVKSLSRGKTQERGEEPREDNEDLGLKNQIISEQEK